MAHDEQKDGLSVKAMVIAVMILIAWFCWATAASAYFGALFEVAAPEPGSGRYGARARGLALIMATVISFVVNSARLNHAPGIIRNVLTNELWILIVFVVLMATALLFGLWVRKLEAELAGPKRKKRRRKHTGRKKRRPRPVE